MSTAAAADPAVRAEIDGWLRRLALHPDCPRVQVFEGMVNIIRIIWDGDGQAWGFAYPVDADGLVYKDPTTGSAAVAAFRLTLEPPAALRAHANKEA